MGFGQAISYNFSNLTNFEGRAPRSQFWWWMLFLWLISLVVNIFTGGLGSLMGRNEFSFLSLVGWIIGIVVVLATVAVGARRLHDTGKSGWLQLLWILPCIGPIILIIFWAQAGNPGDNQYGPPAA